MRLELVSIETDTYPLDGLFYRPEAGAGKGAILIMHGNCGNFYTGVPRHVAPLLVQLGYAVLAFNRRGHDILSIRDSRAAEGAAFQSTQEGIDDNRYAAKWLAARGFARPIVIGHSNGGMLAVRHVSEHPETPAMVLLSAHGGAKGGVERSSKAGLMARDRYEAQMAEARALVAAGRGKELLLMPGWWYVISAESLIDRDTTMPDVVELAPTIRCPTLYVRGDQEDPDAYPAEKFRARAGGVCDVEIVPECDHFYVGREAAVSDLVAGWLARTLNLG
jgi:pimeloyl-ACP methyl ester carboxylesterase